MSVFALMLMLPLLVASQSATVTPFFSTGFSPSFATSPLPIQLAFPTGFTQQSLFFSIPGPAPKAPKGGVFTPANQVIPRDPTASSSVANLVTVYNNVDADKKGDKGLKALYDQGSFRSFNMEISATNRNLMDQDPSAQLKVHCRLTTDYNTPQAKTYSDFSVGCAYKGSVGSLRVCLDENKQDNHICRKLSYRVDARAFKQNNHSAPLFSGAATLLFGGMPVDLSMMSERTAFSLMDSFGMTASLATHAKLFLNGKYLGLFAFVQDVDQEFTKMHFGKDANKGKGGLKKELWFNPLHLNAEIREFTHPNRNDDDMFLETVKQAIDQTPLIESSAAQFFDTFFDVDSLVNLTAFNTVIGATDDWRQRHNFYVYLRKIKKTTKIVFIPWDYDRLYDAGSETRGALKGKPWWDISGTATPLACNQLVRSSQEQAAAMGGSPAKIAWNKDILDQFPPDINVPVTCDKFTKLMALALAQQVRERTREMANQISLPRLRAMWAVWNSQIATALSNDPAGPTYEVMMQHQQLLEQHLTRSMDKALREANAATMGSSFSFAGSPTPFSGFGGFSSVASFTPKTPAAAPAIASRSLPFSSSTTISSSTPFAASSFVPKTTTTTSFGSFPSSTTTSFSTSFATSSPFTTTTTLPATTTTWG